MEKDYRVLRKEALHYDFISKKVGDYEMITYYLEENICRVAKNV